MVNEEKYYMGRDKAYSAELTDRIKSNAKDLISRVNALLKDLGWSKDVQVSSGWRPAAVNSQIANAAKKSLHQTGEAVDIVDDKEQSLSKLIMSKPELLKKHGLWLEHPEATKGKNTNWTHLDCSKVRKDRPVRVFKP